MTSIVAPIYFYKAAAPYGCFSNFSQHPIYCEQLDWPTVEHFYQAHKFIDTIQQDLIDHIRLASTPEQAAALGRDPKHLVRPDWSQLKDQVMWIAIWTKFSSHPDIAQILLSTGDAEIIENSPVDYYWGCGADGSGKNRLGRMLMNLRQRIKAQA